MDSTDSGQDIPLPFGRTSTTVDELHTLVEVDKAVALLEENGVTSPEKRIEEFLEAVPSLLAWLKNTGRNFSWRNTTDPWRVYVSEILLQRTRADAVSGIYDDFFDRFPEPAAIREASEEEIRDSVSSLGFVNHRTRTLEDVAQILGEDHGDSVPASLKELQRPWRVGPYSARATMIFAFHKPMALVDTNFARVGERVFDYEMPSQPHKSKEVYQFFDALMPRDPGLCRALNLALLDLANAICTPSDPQCPKCPVSDGCNYFQETQG